MAFVLLAVSIVYLILWIWGLAQSARSTGDRAVWAAGIGVVGWIAATGVTGMASMDAMNNPTRMSPDNYNAIQEGMAPEQIKVLLGEPSQDVDLESLKLDMKGIFIAAVTQDKLRSGTHADAIISKATLEFSGEPGKPGQKETLGAKAIEEGNGVTGLVFELTQGEDKLTITEGVDWTYERDMTAEDITRQFVQLIDDSPLWTAEGGEEGSERNILLHPEVGPENEAWGGALGNEATAQVMTGPNSSLRVQFRTDGEVRNFDGGSDQVDVLVWFEEGKVLDADFSSEPRIILVGVVGGVVVGKDQFGIIERESAW